MPKPGNFNQLLDQLDMIARPPRARRLPVAVDLPATTPFGLLAERKWVISGILRLAYSVPDDGDDDKHSQLPDEADRTAS